MNFYLFFSDAAKYADVARNIFFGNGYHTSFSFFLQPLFSGMWIPPVMPVSISIFFRIFGVNDLAVISTSLFYFILVLLFSFLLTKKIFDNNLIAVLSVLVIGFDQNLIHYAINGASEAPFIFEIIASLYFISQRTKSGNLLSIFVMIIMYFTRTQAFIYIAGIMLYGLLTNFNFKKALSYFFIIGIACLILDYLVLAPLTGKYFLYSVLGRGSNILSQVAISQSASDQLRNGILTYDFSMIGAFKKIMYNLYNFYKLFPQIASPYLVTLFVLSLIRWDKNKIQNSFKLSSLFMVLTTFVVTAASVPFFRYIHPVLPLIYVISIDMLVWIVVQVNKSTHGVSKKMVVATTFLLVTIFIIGQTLGAIFLDPRFKKNIYNLDKPPVYFVLSKTLEENTNKNDIVITNLDTWGSWYGERKTIWYPIKPSQLIDPIDGKIHFNAIYLTSYLIDDENYYMGEGWRSIFENPKNPEKWQCEGCDEISKEFILKDIYYISKSNVYENTDAQGVLLKKK